MIVLTGSTGLYLAQSWPDHPGIRFAGVRITEGPLYFEVVKGGEKTMERIT
jgi:hypothetical protein